MSEYPKIIERPYKVYSGKQKYIDRPCGESIRTEILWTYRHSFESEPDANVYATRAAQNFEFVKIEKKKESN